jgi:hypothetical protein
MTQPRKIKECKHHGEVEFVRDNSNRWRCTKCRVESVTKARRKRKKKLVEHFGNKCSLCGYNKSQSALHFHHIDPETKEFGIAYKGYCRSWEKMLAEAEKCILVCANCHAESHDT